MVLVAELILLTGPRAFAESAANLVKQGNRAYAQDKMDDAAAAYDKALEKMPESARILYDKGCTLYKKGDYKSASDMFEKAATYSDDDSLDAKIHFNMGNSMFKAAQSEKSDPDTGLSDIQRSISHYEKAVNLDPAFDAAAQNLEIARMAYKQLEEMLKQRQKQAQAQKERQERMKKDLKDLIHRQESLARKSKEEQSRKARSKNQDEGKKLARKQEKLQQDTQKLSQKMASGSSPDQQKNMESAQRKLKSVMDQQAGAQKDLEHSKFDSAGQKQKTAADELRNALSEMEKNSKNSKSRKETQKAEKNQSPPTQDKKPGVDQSAKNQKPPQQAANVASQDPDKILQEEQQRRLDQKAARGAWQPVDKDW